MTEEPIPVIWRYKKQGEAAINVTLQMAALDELPELDLDVIATTVNPPDSAIIEVSDYLLEAIEEGRATVDRFGNILMDDTLLGAAVESKQEQCWGSADDGLQCLNLSTTDLGLCYSCLEEIKGRIEEEE